MNYYFYEQIDNFMMLPMASVKAREDAVLICKKLGWKELPIYFEFIPQKSDGIIKKIQQHFCIYKKWKQALDGIGPGDCIFMQYPFFYNTILVGKFLKLCKRRHVKTYILIHDLNSLRFEKNLKMFLSERPVLLTGQKLIVHNDKMKEYLSGRGVPVNKMVSLHVFDYLGNENLECKAKEMKIPSVCVAGNLSKEKSAYLYSLGEIPLLFFLYGDGYTGVTCDTVVHKGRYRAEELLAAMEGAYGLVWDGDNLDTCSGSYGNYERYNNPHKLSLYLAAGKPVVVWRHAAISEFVKENHIGIMVDSLYDLPKMLEDISEKEYEIMQHNAIDIGNEIRKGMFLERALQKCAK